MKIWIFGRRKFPFYGKIAMTDNNEKQISLHENQATTLCNSISYQKSSF